ncbi:hypothetical protein DFQ28_004791 [Apophysomyces sp. BC1034]|nr:hypothetical protein DFQ30_004614 [Apophysomyces sp. BC1015]KAG0178220.1 hypothetical protein DFQ29_003792 [Apophysomyces sp. BC1021]KAG0188481.1 hypothetical protein DFQ28_004791 [Apophysomyces sp. BC1034]
MREPNFSVPSQQRAATVISSTLYDRRALDCTATLPLVNSLTHLAYMTSTSPRIREILAGDGGLERLLKILTSCQHTDRRSLWKWSLALQCVVNIGVRGTETIRTRVVDAGAIHVILTILENFLSALDQVKLEKQQELDHTSTALSLPTTPLHPSHSRSTPVTPARRLFGHSHSAVESSQKTLTSPPITAPSSDTATPFTAPRRQTFLALSVRSKSKSSPSSPSSIPLLKNLSADATVRREEDVLLSLQLLAYLSKYPHLRQSLHTAYRRNIFSVVEKFTNRFHPNVIIYWAGVIMRNACRKDETQGGLRQCAYMQCGKWERYPREFAKCRRCRKAKYCSKICQSRAWNDGHRWWCVERSQAGQTSHSSATTSTAAAAAASVAAATAQPAPPSEQMMQLDRAEATTVLPITINDQPSNMQIDTDDADDNIHRRSSLAINDPGNQNSPHTNSNEGRRDHNLLYHIRRRNSRSTRSLASGSSTEVEVETENTPDRTGDLMDVD